jgi:S1-C subfamily serine protease
MLGVLFSALLAAQYPEQLDAMLQIKHESGTGFGVPLPGGQVLTVAHLVPEEGKQIVYISPTNDIGNLTVTWSDTEQDIALLQANKQFKSTIKISSKPVEAGSEVFYKIMLGHDNYTSWTSGKVLGLDSYGDLLIHGWFAPGTSGSGILNSLGELVGVVQAGENLSARGPKVGESEATNLARIFKRTSFPPVMAAKPIVKKIPEKK